MGIHELLLGDNDAPLRESHRSLLEQASRSGDALLELIGAVLVRSVLDLAIHLIKADLRANA